MNVENKTGIVGNHREWELETTFDGNEVAEWLTENLNLGLACALVYLAAVFAGQKYMENQPRYNLRQPMMIWSLLLAIFSIIGSIRSMIVMYHVGQDGGFRGLVCSERFYVGPITRFWGPVFVFSKILEYMDTAFIILRKQKLIFLHWYHHLTVSLFSWWCYGSQFAGGGIFMTVNFVVHSLMYTYYAVRAAGFKVPKPIAIVITASQIIQMIIGCIAVYCAHIWRHDGDCKTSSGHVLYGSIMYGSYFVLFVHFFYVTYVKKQPIRIKTLWLCFFQRKKLLAWCEGNGQTPPRQRRKEIEESSRSDIKAKEVSSSTNETSSNYDLRQRKVEAISS